MPIRNLRFLSLPNSCRRRRRALAQIAVDIFFARGDSRALTPAAWLAFFGLYMFLTQSEAPDAVLLPSVSLFAGLCLISLFDARYFVIPDGPLLFLCIAAPFVWPTFDLREAIWRLTAAAAAYASLTFVAYAYETVRGQAGLGNGDARLYAVAGLWLGLQGLPSCLVYAAVSALLSAVIALRLGALSDSRAPLPFGPHLALGVWLSYALGPLEFG